MTNNTTTMIQCDAGHDKDITNHRQRDAILNVVAGHHTGNLPSGYCQDCRDEVTPPLKIDLSAPAMVGSHRAWCSDCGDAATMRCQANRHEIY